MKLIFEHHWGDEPCSGTDIIPFEYSSKEDFVLMILDKFNSKFWKDNSFCELFGSYLYKDDIENLEYNVYTLDEWFERKKYKF
jgi:hypothetical protein